MKVYIRFNGFWDDDFWCFLIYQSIKLGGFKNLKKNHHRNHFTLYRCCWYVILNVLNATIVKITTLQHYTVPSYQLCTLQRCITMNTRQSFPSWRERFKGEQARVCYKHAAFWNRRPKRFYAFRVHRRRTYTR